MFGRDPSCTLVLRPADLNNEHADMSISRIAGEFVTKPNGTGGKDIEVWNYSSTNWLIVTGDRGYTMNLAPRSRGVLTHEETVLWIEGQEANYGFYVYNPDLADVSYKDRYEELATKLGVREDAKRQTLLASSAESLRGSFAPAHQLILETMFKDYLSPHPGVFPRPRSVRDVQQELLNSRVIKASYNGPLSEDHVSRVLRNAIETARNFKVPGLEQSLDRRPVDQGEWTRHRLAMFLLGAGIITRSDE